MRRPPGDVDDLCQLGRCEPSDDLADALLIEQVNGGYDRLGHALRGGPTEVLIIELDPVRVAERAAAQEFGARPKIS